MNCCGETARMGVPPGNRPAVPRDWSEAYLNGTSQGEPVLPVPSLSRGACRRNTRGRQEGRSYPWSQQVIHEISGLTVDPLAR
jgi:hypothetical protein